MTEKSFRINPWLSIWVKPRQTIRSIVNYNVSYRFLAICSILGFLQVLICYTFFPTVPFLRGLLILPLPILFMLALLFEYFHFTISAAFLYWGGKMLKGKGSFKQIRAAIYWASVPRIATFGLSILLGLIIAALCVVKPSFFKPIFIVGLMWGLSISSICWAVVILVCTLVEVQKFSTWRTILNIILAIIFWAVLLIIGSFLFNLVFNYFLYR